MKDIPDGSIDMILCDPPFGTTASRWDKTLSFELLWEQYRRVIRKNGAIALFGAEPFASKLRLSAEDLFKYDWVWVKNNAVGFVNAKLKPMNKHEMVLVFSKGKTANRNKNNMPYFPQGLVPYGKEVRSGNKQGKDNSYWRPSLKSSNGSGYVQEFTNYPTSVLFFDKVQKAVHPTQKPVALLEYLIKTYTNSGEVILDNCMGSGSTGVACVNTGRRFIGMELDPTYFDIASQRIRAAQEEALRIASTM
jgi:site-specific DNA-methyltransferase (adenine-specific)